ncbi:MAG: hypothetical protein MUE85_17180 [Microscillaceae bacterium]|jgi:hypothetical protein|nr:hypothetical protein [Microscillaceae bacterium]
MLALSNKTLWQELDNAYGNSEEIPALIQQLQKEYSQKLLNEICWEYIFHQNSLYQATFATIPYLIELAEKVENITHKWEFFINLGLIIADFDYQSPDYLQDLYANCSFIQVVINDIISSYQNSFKKLQTIANQLIDYTKTQDEAEKRYFLACFAVVNELYSVGKVFQTFDNNNEYMCVCGVCKSEFHLWNENNQLVLYLEDPIFNKKQKSIPIIPNRLKFSEADLLNKSNKYAWLKYHIHLLEINSLKNIVDYLFAEINCPSCENRFRVFEQIEYSIL